MSAIKSAAAIKPLLDRVLVQRVKAVSKTASGIYIPDKNQDKLPYATVISAGPGIKNNKGELVTNLFKAGDKVILPSYGGSAIKVNDEEFLMYSDKEILAKIED